MKKCMGSVSPETSLRGMFSRRKEKKSMKDFGSHFLMNGITVFKLMCKRRPAVLSFHHPKKSKKSAPRRPRETSSFAKTKLFAGCPVRQAKIKKKNGGNKIRLPSFIYLMFFFSGTKIPVHHLGPAKIRFFGGGSLHKKEGQVRYPLQAPRLL